MLFTQILREEAEDDDISEATEQSNAILAAPEKRYDRETEELSGAIQVGRVQH